MDRPGGGRITEPGAELPPELLTADEVAALLRIAPRTALHLARTGRLPAFKVGGSVRFHRVVIERLVAQGAGERRSAA